MKKIPVQRSKQAGSCLTCEAPPKQRAAMARAMAVVASADGKLSVEERGFLHEAFAAIPAFEKLPSETIDQIVLEALQGIAEEGPEASIVQVAEELPSPELRRAAFSLAAAVALSDERLMRSEADTLALLASGLGLSEGEAKKIIDGLRDL